ncbi:MAG: glycosyltransferase [Bacteroidota bacterium]
MLLLAIIGVSLSIAYALVIGIYIYFWERLALFQIPQNHVETTQISVVIAARNEALQIEACLQSILHQSYPDNLFEVILIDDHSTDTTAQIASQIDAKNLTVIQLKEDSNGKKNALTKGIQVAKGELIVTTDADCVAPKGWLSMLEAFYQEKKAKFIAAPVIFSNESNSIEYFQSLDFMGMMFITGAGIEGQFMNMSNGANLAYPKSVYQELNGFANVDHIASGDDILFMQKVAQVYPDDIHFIKNPSVAVQTQAMPNWNTFFQQRLRWGTKSAQYPEWKITAILAIVFFFCWSILLSLVAIPFLGIPMAYLFIFLLFTKSIIDFVFLRKASLFFRKEQLMKHFLIAQVYHIVYIALVGLASNLIKTYEWKGRRVK